MTNLKDELVRDTEDGTVTGFENSYVSIVERMQDGIIVVREGIILFANSSFLRIVEYDHEELIGKDAGEILSPQSRGYLEQRQQDLAMGRELQRVFDMEILTMGGRGVSVEANVSLIDYQDDIADLLVLRETTGHQQRKDSINSEQPDQWLYSILEGIPNLILVVDREGTILFANHGSEDRSKEDLEGISLFNYMDSDYHRVVSDGLNTVFEIGTRDYFVTRIVKEDGSNIWCETHAGPVKRNGEIVAAVLVNADITRRKKREEKIEEKFQEIEIRSYQMEAANSEMQQNQMQLIDLNQKLMESQSRLQETMSNLREAQADPSTSVIQLWDGILMLPFHSIKKSSHAREMMDTLINKISETQAETVMLDINGISTINDFFIRVLGETISMAEMMGAKAVVVGAQPEVAVALNEYGIKAEQSR